LYSSAQQKVELPEYGVSFEIPNGWTAQEEGDYIFMGHNSIPGLIIIFENTAQSTSQLREEALKGIIEEGVNLQAKGDFSISENKVEGYYEGVFQGTQARAFAVGLISRVGSGFTAMVLTEKSQFSKVHLEEMNKLTSSVRFSQISGTYATAQWKKWLTGSQLRYLYTSGGSDYGGGYSGTSQDEKIELCSNGSFLYNSSSSSSFDVSGGFGSTHGSNDGNGTYEIYGTGGRTYLKLLFKNGKVTEYEVTTNDKDHTLLDGYRYFLVEPEGCQ